MALETKPIPVLRGKAAMDFWKKVENFKTTETPEHIREVNRWVRKSVEEQRQREERAHEIREKMISLQENCKPFILSQDCLISDFDCGNEELNDFFNHKALPFRTKVVHLQHNQK